MRFPVLALAPAPAGSNPTTTCGCRPGQSGTPRKRRKNRRGAETIRMIVRSIPAAPADARYEKIEDEKPFHGEIPGLRSTRPRSAAT